MWSSNNSNNKIKAEIDLIDANIMPGVINWVKPNLLAPRHKVSIEVEASRSNSTGMSTYNGAFSCAQSSNIFLNLKLDKNVSITGECYECNALLA